MTLRVKSFPHPLYEGLNAGREEQCHARQIRAIFLPFSLCGAWRALNEKTHMQYSLFEEFVSLDNLIRAFQDVATGKSENEEFVIYALNFEENLINLQNRLIPDERLLSLIFLILDGFEGKGLPIGFLLSQGFSNLVGSIVDYYVTDILGVGKYYIRYADDFRIIVHTRREAMNVLYAVDDLVCNKMHQSLSEGKTKIVKYSGKDTFCGFVVCPHHLEAKSETVKRHERRIGKKMKLYEEGHITLQKVSDSTHSAVDYLIKTDARSEIIERNVLTLYNQGIRTKDFKKLVIERGLK